jgi:uncharacterized protein DUF5989
MTDRSGTKFEQAVSDRGANLFTDFRHFLWRSKKWWLVPIVVVLLMLGVLMFAGGTAVAPFIYTLF